MTFFHLPGCAWMSLSQNSSGRSSKKLASPDLTLSRFQKLPPRGFFLSGRKKADRKGPSWTTTAPKPTFPSHFGHFGFFLFLKDHLRGGSFRNLEEGYLHPPSSLFSDDFERPKYRVQTSAVTVWPPPPVPVDDLRECQQSIAKPLCRCFLDNLILLHPYNTLLYHTTLHLSLFWTFLESRAINLDSQKINACFLFTCQTSKQFLATSIPGFPSTPPRRVWGAHWMAFPSCTP